MVLKECPLLSKKSYVLCLKEKYVKDFIDFLNFRKNMFRDFYCNPSRLEYSLFVERLIVEGNSLVNFVD